MAKRKQTYQQKVNKYKFFIFAGLVFIIYMGFSFVSSSVYGVALQDVPTHNTPKSCEEAGYQICTTAAGACTKDIKKCLIPKSESDCQYTMFYKKWDSKRYFKDHPKSKAKWLMNSEQYEALQYKYQNYCASPEVKFYEQASSGSQKYVLWVVEFILAVTAFTLMYPEINSIAENLAH